MKIVDRVHEGKPARFVSVVAVNGQIYELGYFTKPKDPDYNRMCDRALLHSMKYTLEQDKTTERQ